jgi:sec-independent protein translocase protein TatA
MPNLRGSEWLIIILLLALLFGAKRLPDAARSIGRSLRIFKAETKGLADDAPPATPPAGAAQTVAAPLTNSPAPATPIAPATPVAPPPPPPAQPVSDAPTGGGLAPQPPPQA